MSDSKPVVVVNDEELTTASLTAGGKQHFAKTANDYARALLAKSVHCCKADQTTDGRLEVTGVHVSKAAHLLASFGLDRPPKWATFLQGAEYILAIGIGVGASNVKESWGQLL